MHSKLTCGVSFLRVLTPKMRIPSLGLGEEQRAGAGGGPLCTVAYTWLSVMESISSKELEGKRRRDRSPSLVLVNEDDR